MVCKLNRNYKTQERLRKKRKAKIEEEKAIIEAEKAEEDMKIAEKV